MKKTYLYIFIVALLALVIFASGCINQDGNTTSQSNTTGSYSVNGLSFSYPVDWILVSQTSGNVQFINIVDQAFGESNGTTGSSIEVVSQPKNENLTFDSIKESFTNGTDIEFNTTEGTKTVAGINATTTTLTAADESGNQTQIQLIYLEKDNFVYILNFMVIGSSNVQSQQQYFDTVVNSIKIP